MKPARHSDSEINSLSTFSEKHHEVVSIKLIYRYDKNTLLQPFLLQ